MKASFKGRFANITKQKVLMKNGKPVLDKQGNQIPIGNKEHYPDFDNTIHDSGLNNIGTLDVCSKAYVSSNNDAPLNTDSVVLDKLGVAGMYSRKDVNKDLTVNPIWFDYSYLYKFRAGEGTGNISKIYIGNQENKIWASELIKDINGNPATITKLEDEILEMTYIVRTYINIDDWIGKINISGKEHDVVLRPSKISNWTSVSPTFFQGFADRVSFHNGNSILGTIEEIPTENFDITHVNMMDYVEESKEMKYKATALPDTANHDTGIGALRYYDRGTSISFQASISPPIMKTERDILELPNFVISWDRY